MHILKYVEDHGSASQKTLFEVFDFYYVNGRL